MFKHILIPIDSQQLSHQAAKVGLECAQRLQAQVTLLHVLQIPPVYPPQSEHATLETIRNHGKKLLEPWPDLAAKDGVSLKTKMVQDDAHSVAASIVKAANGLECDVMMGTQGREGLDRLLVGSVAERVTRLANPAVQCACANAEISSSFFDVAVAFGEFDRVEFEFGGECFSCSGHGCLVLLLEA